MAGMLSEGEPHHGCVHLYPTGVQVVAPPSSWGQLPARAGVPEGLMGKALRLPRGARGLEVQTIGAGAQEEMARTPPGEFIREQE
jgi:hypothetical protein